MKALGIVRKLQSMVSIPLPSWLVALQGIIIVVSLCFYYVLALA